MKKKIKLTGSKKQKKPRVAIIGLGYVGLPLACLTAEKGYQTFGIDKDDRKIQKINKKESPILDKELTAWLPKVSIQATYNYAILATCEIVIICVPTPVDALYNPDLKPVINSAQGIRDYLHKGQLIIVESTVNPGVCEEVILPILSESHLKPGEDFFLAHCPERINPGDPKWNVRNIPRVVGGLNEMSQKKALEFYQSIIEAPIRPMHSLKEAEATKIVENSFRDINIAFVNELANSFEKLHIDIVDVIAGAATKPFAFLPHWPGVGVGGHCIPVDPYYLIERAKQSGFDHKFLKLAREINNSMPKHTVERLQQALNEMGRAVKNTKIGLLGLSYKPNLADLRESPALTVIHLLQELEADIEIFDPFVPEKSTAPNLEALLKKSDVLMLLTAHKEFRKLHPRQLIKNNIKIIIDGRNCLNKNAFQQAGILYRGIGR